MSYLAGSVLLALFALLAFVLWLLCKSPKILQVFGFMAVAVVGLFGIMTAALILAGIPQKPEPRIVSWSHHILPSCQALSCRRT